MSDTMMGSAYVTVHAITSAIKKEIKSSLDQSDSAFKQSGEKAGKSFGTAISQNIKKSVSGDLIERALGNVRTRLTALRKNFDEFGIASRNRFASVAISIGLAVPALAKLAQVGAGVFKGIANGIGAIASAGGPLAGAIQGATMAFGSLGAAIRKASIPLAHMLPTFDQLKEKAGSTLSFIGTSLKSVVPEFGKLDLIAGLIPLVTSLFGGLLSLGGSLGRAASASLTLVGVLGSVIQVALVGKLAFSGFAKAVQGADGAMAKLAPNAQKAAVAVRGLAAPFDGLKKSIQQAFFNGTVVSQIGLLSNTIKSLTPALAETGRQFGLLAGDVLTWANNTTYLNTAIQGNNKIFNQLRQAAVPLLDGLLKVFIALQPAAQRLATHIHEVALSFQSWASAPGTAKKIDDFMRRAEASASLLWDTLKQLGGALGNIFGQASKGDGVLKTINGIATAFNKWSQNAENVKALTSGIFNPAIFGTFLSTIGKIASVLMKAFAPVGEQIGKALTTIMPLLGQLATALGPLLKGIGDVIANVFKQAIPIIATVLKILIPVVAFLSNVLGAVLSKLAPVIAFIILAFTSWGAKLISFIPIIGKIVAPIITFVNFLIGKLGPALELIGGVFAKVFGAIFSVVGKVFGKIVSTVGSGLSKIASVVTSVLGKIGSFFSKTWQAVSKAVGSAWTTIISAVSKGVSSVVKFITGLKDKVVGALKTAGTWLLKVGENIMSGLVKGIANGFSWVKTKITELGSNIVSWAKNILHIGSPSRVMRDEIGQWIPRGIAAGIDDGMKQLVAARDRMGVAINGGSAKGSIAAAINSGGRAGVAGSSEGAAGSTDNSQQNNLTQNFNYFGVQTGSDRRQQSEWYHRYAAQFGSPTMAQGGN